MGGIPFMSIGMCGPNDMVFSRFGDKLGIDLDHFGHQMNIVWFCYLSCTGYVCLFFLK